MRDRLDKYIYKKRNEIYARLRMPKVLVNHYMASSDFSGLSVNDEIPYEIFNSQKTFGSKSLFSEEDSAIVNQKCRSNKETPFRRKERFIKIEMSEDLVGDDRILICSDKKRDGKRKSTMCCSLFDR
jgi:hypothetical protein